ncbi:MAG: hypothetical protein CTY28_09605 [Hyphomicrobium sp.]|nr:MAG: hypothetical protein CTY28_09605 [Hyphomicrobium sp.]
MKAVDFKKYWTLSPYDDDSKPCPEFDSWWDSVIKAADDAHREAKRLEQETRERRDATLAKLATAAAPMTEARALPGELAASDFLTFDDSMSLDDVVEALRALDLTDQNRIDTLLMQGRWGQTDIARATGFNQSRVNNRNKHLKLRAEHDPELAKILPESVRRPGALRNKLRVVRGER